MYFAICVIEDKNLYDKLNRGTLTFIGLKYLVYSFLCAGGKWVCVH